jgi:transketolase
VINALAPVLPMLIGGSADLGVSNNTDIKESHSFEAATYDGRILHFGVREHAMGSTLTGISLNGGLIPYGGTFMTFSGLHAARDSVWRRFRSAGDLCLHARLSIGLG